MAIEDRFAIFGHREGAISEGGDTACSSKLGNGDKVGVSSKGWELAGNTGFTGYIGKGKVSNVAGVDGMPIRKIHWNGVGIRSAVVNGGRQGKEMASGAGVGNGRDS